MKTEKEHSVPEVIEEMKQKLEDLGLEQCIGCRGIYPIENIQDRGEPTCDNCCDDWDREIRATGIEHLDEYLKSRNIEADFNFFARAKWSCVTEEELKDLED